jgi:hypothetical protein
MFQEFRRLGRFLYGVLDLHVLKLFCLNCWLYIRGLARLQVNGEAFCSVSGLGLCGYFKST